MIISGMDRGVCGLDSSESGTGPVTGCYECDNEPSGFIKCRELLD
jgi:hypothetical protein